MQIRYVKQQFVSTHPASTENRIKSDVICPWCRGAFTTRAITEHIIHNHAFHTTEIFRALDAQRPTPTCRCGKPVAWSWDRRDWDEFCPVCRANFDKISAALRAFMRANHIMTFEADFRDETNYDRLAEGGGCSGSDGIYSELRLTLDDGSNLVLASEFNSVSIFNKGGSHESRNSNP